MARCCAVPRAGKDVAEMRRRAEVLQIARSRIFCLAGAVEAKHCLDKRGGPSKV